MKKTVSRMGIISSLTLALSIGPSLRASADATVGVKNFREVVQFFLDTTQVPSSDPLVNAQIASSTSRLPKTGLVGELTPSALLTFTALAGVYCQEMIASDSKLVGADIGKRRAHSKVDFTKGPSALTATVQQSVMEEYAGLFWMRSPSAIEISAMSDVFAQGAAGAPDTADQTPLVLLGVCASAASSLDALVN